MSNAPTPTTKLIGFGAPAEYGAHVFKVQIPPGRSGLVVLSEEFGLRAGVDGTPERIIRAQLDRSLWTPLADISRRDFNARLRATKSSPGTWKPQENVLDRMLGKELAILMWAAEPASSKEIDTICEKWSALRPEERWWLYSMTSAEAGGVGDRNRGWRKALFYALSDGEGMSTTSVKIPEAETSERMSLFL
ncbi:anti-phage-associated DUF3780 domain-containing protein [Acidithrix sp. C25]|uniref:anti-phage-associated DUF3780 domain-containing protein n=1 Tax=Acidithrix sp. C25 TaxID=1671482 RepID=UPI00191B9084|nr:anti-phage-associated DUF3780 domain-containing protein [Acidithrix sp. C25]CAG4907464.1 unnamed protein product [Acidithrix sp. C25]